MVGPLFLFLALYYINLHYTACKIYPETFKGVLTVG